MDELAKLYIRRDGKTYRFKVFENIITIEQQPGGDNIVMDKGDGDNASMVYSPDTGIWDYDALSQLIEAYQDEITHEQ
jgi:hypothetical protein